MTLEQYVMDEMNGTRVVCNPRGYVRSNHAENPEFNPSLIIEI